MDTVKFILSDKLAFSITCIVIACIIMTGVSIYQASKIKMEDDE